MEKDIFSKIETANKVDFGEILSKSFELFKKVWQEGLIHGLITMALMIPVIIIAYVPMVAILMNTPNYQYDYYNDYYNYNEPLMDYPVLWIVGFMLLFFALTFVAQTVVYGVIGHFFRVLKKADLGTDEDTGGYFVYLKGKHLKKIFVLSLATFGISLLAVLLCYLPIFYVLVPLKLFITIFVYNEDLSVSDIIKASFKLGHKFWLILFGLIFIAGTVAQIGLILCVVGYFATAYFVHVPIYYFYKDAIGFDQEEAKITV